jgi:uncharacterized protein YbbC (DUF1343 family)
MKNQITLLIFAILTAHIFRAQPIVYNREIKVGSEQFDAYLPLLKGKTVAVVANQTSVVGTTHLVDTLLSRGIRVIKVFAPEHGFRGTADAGEYINNEKDAKTGLPILSLYGKKNRKPAIEKLADTDVVLFDLQDVGARFYTYISTMHYVMEACAEHNKPIIVLDRPNPNGFYVDGPLLKTGAESFIGMHKVPVVHGMTIGEYAQMINEEKWLLNGVLCSLTVIPCANYSHSDLYELPVPPSPNLPNMAAVFLYPSLCFFEGTDVSLGRGTTKPFQQYGAPYLKSDYFFTPQPMFGAKEPLRNGEKCYGFDLSGFEKEIIASKQLHFEWLIGAYKACPHKDAFFRKDGFFKLLSGDPKIQKMIVSGATANDVRASYQSELEAFKILRKSYLLYPDFE